MDDIYNSKILEFAGNIIRVGALNNADAVAEKHSRLCGSRLKAFVTVDGDKVTDFSQELRACALGQASASIMARHVVGASFTEIRKARADMLDMLKEGGEGPQGRFEDLRYLMPVKDYKARHASTMLILEALCDCLDQVEARQSALAG
ncbi:iron-sulfur cluster assembly scaffold protein [Agrobacterium vitis]|uniref:iron-sulfur cluster assembly scaffold protein n=1 Tax=Agrobacterium vitis TaxID=373 RepID=UPI003D2E656D